MTARGTTHQPRVHRVPRRFGGAHEMGAGDSRRTRQPVGAQDQGCGPFPGGASESALSFHTDLLILAESGGTLVCQDPARRIRRGVFTSVADLGTKLRKYIRAYSKSAKPFRWTYTDPSRRIRPNKIAGTAY